MDNIIQDADMNVPYSHRDDTWVGFDDPISVKAKVLQNFN